MEGKNHVADPAEQRLPLSVAGSLEKLCTETDSKPAHGMETPEDRAWAGQLAGASLAVFPVLSKKPKVPICCTILTSNSPDLKNGLPSGGTTASTCEAQQTGLLLAF